MSTVIPRCRPAESQRADNGCCASSNRANVNSGAFSGAFVSPVTAPQLPGGCVLVAVVGSQARILYSDQKGRVALAMAFNQAIARGKIKAPVVLSRDHHDVSGTDSPFRETSNICDGSAFCADMAVQNFVGGAFRGATWVALHNGGGVGW
ncbi:hypothetical protein J1605_006408 [Eschrichtius robustus]|uniref:Urocanase C-terminal domain-containing protein n=1 Tax=Eschrichtius robustus TaxID=9764 RepID=A0AB34H335_ESCRO|nr:hypothetical protein J1605_006408 [Eschrichtius robustus]